MPIYEQTYRQVEVSPGHTWRWLQVAKQEVRLARTATMYRLLLFLSVLPFLISLFILVVADLMSTNPSQLMRSVVQHIQYANVDARFFRLYLMLVSPFVFFFVLYVGAGSICNDYRHNLLEVYFAKPLTRWQYFVGKLAGVCFIPTCLTIVAVMVLFLLHIVMAPSNAGEFLRNCYWVPFALLALSATMVIPPALFMMACSSFGKSTAYTSVIAVAVLFMNGAISNALAEILNWQNLRCFSFVRSMVHLGDLMFEGRTRITVSWETITISLVAFSVVCAGVVLWRIRKVEITS